jgi:hypothetical protein
MVSLVAGLAAEPTEAENLAVEPVAEAPAAHDVRAEEEPPWEQAFLAGLVLETGLLEEGGALLGPELEYGHALAQLTPSVALALGGRCALLINDHRSAGTRVETYLVELGPWLELRWLLGARVLLAGGVGASLGAGVATTSSSEEGLVGFGVGFVPTARARVAFAPFSRVVLSLAGYVGGALYTGSGMRGVGGFAVSAGVGF